MDEATDRTLTDRQIVEALLKRDENGIKMVQCKYGARLKSIAERLLSKEDAEECVNDTYLALWNHIPPEEPTYLWAYMTRILNNLARNRWKAQKRLKRDIPIIELSEDLERYIQDPGADTEQTAISHVVITEAINQFLKETGQIKREIFVLRYWYGWESGEIALRYGFSKTKTEKILSRMKQLLIKKITEHDEDESKRND